MGEHSLAGEVPVGGGLAHSDCGPTVLRILLGSQLRRLRRARKLTREAAGRAVRVSAAKISRLEQGRFTLEPRRISALLSFYGVQDPEEQAALLMLTRQVGISGWWQRNGEALPTWTEVHAGLEEAASVIRTYDMQFVPALLQTEDYCRAVTPLVQPVARLKEIDERVELVMRRQEKLTGPHPPKLWAILEEAALRRSYGDPGMMRAQIDHLITMAALPHITLSIVPLVRDTPAVANAPFSILRFDGPELPDVVYLEQLTHALYFDKHEDTHHYMAVMDLLGIEASLPAATPKLMAGIRDEMF